MKGKIKKTTAVSLAAVLLTGSIAYGSQGQESINVLYDDIKIIIDGIEYTPRDANGAVVEPFVYNGTTYLPVRGVAGAFGKEVEWDPQSSTVYLGDRDFDWLDQMGYVDYDASKPNNVMTTISSKTKSTDGLYYDRGLDFQLNYGGYDSGLKELNDGTLLCYQEVSYLINRNYETFEGTFCGLDYDLPTDGREQHVLVKVYGDDNLLYTSPILTKGCKSTPFNIDISNYKILKIRVEIPNVYKGFQYAHSNIGIADARLSKSY